MNHAVVQVTFRQSKEYLKIAYETSPQKTPQKIISGLEEKTLREIKVKPPSNNNIYPSNNNKIVEKHAKREISQNIF